MITLSIAHQQSSYADFAKYVKGVMKGKTPSVAAKSVGYKSNQASHETALLDGRLAQNGPSSTSALPIQIYHPVFGHFLQRCRDTTVAIPEDVLRYTAALLRSVTEISTQEAPRDAKTREILAQILSVPLEHISNQDKTSPEYMSLASTLMNISAASSIKEVKGELGIGGSDPSVQCSFSFARFYCSEEVSSIGILRGCKSTYMFQQRSPIRNASCCPAFLVGLAGPWIVIMGAVLTSRTIVQRLTPYEWLGCSRLFDDQQVHRIAHRLYALRESIAELNAYYARLSSSPAEHGHLHPRFFPSITSFSTGGKKTRFVYAYPLEHDAASVTFKATLTETKKPIVIKFVRRYGDEAHQLLADHGLAPKLLAFEQLGELYDDLNLVAMELVEGQTLQDIYGDAEPLPDPVKDAIRRGLNFLKEKGLVFGDLRRPNIMLVDGDEPIQDRIRFIDFDWAGLEDERLRYPFHLSSVVCKPSGALEYDLVTREHQESMFRNL